MNWRLHRGNTSEAMVIAAFTAKNITVCLPSQDGCVYDVVADVSGLKKVQIKTGRLIRDGRVIAFSKLKPSLQRFKDRPEKIYTQEEIDFFAVYVPDLKKVYLVPNSVTLNRLAVYLQLQEPSKKIRKGYLTLRAQDYDIYSF